MRFEHDIMVGRYLVDVIREHQDFEASAKLAADSSGRYFLSK